MFSVKRITSHKMQRLPIMSCFTWHVRAFKKGQLIVISLETIVNL